MRNYEMADGSWDMERENADELQESLEQSGNLQAKRLKRMKAFLDAGDLEGAARACPHGWSKDVKGMPGHSQCLHCGSIVKSEYPKFGDQIVTACVPIAE